MESRRIVIQLIFIAVFTVIGVKLFFIQVVESDYKEKAESNILQRITTYPHRGIIYDRNGNLLVANTPVYNLQVIPREVADNFDKTSFCQLVDLSPTEFDERIQKARKYSRVKNSDFIKQISQHDFAKIQDKLIGYPGFYEEARTVRFYPYENTANAFGYLGEVSPNQLKKDTAKYYNRGDYIGVSGLESYYEDYLRGKRGVRYVMVNVNRIVKGSFKEGLYDTLAIPGDDLISSIDADLQAYAEQLMKGKIGSVVAIEPSSGEILSMVSAPTYNPNILSGKGLRNNFQALQKDSLNPLFNRPIMATYPPGSIFKTIQALIALQEGVIKPNESIASFSSPMGDHAAFGYYDIPKGIKYSSNTFFYTLFKRIINQNENSNTYVDTRLGVAKWKAYLENFGLGKRLGIDLPNEKRGSLPSISYYDKIYGENQWKFSNIYSLSIGQGELLVTPIQMANLAAAIANKGYYYRPHLVKGIGDNRKPLPPFQEKIYTGIDSAYFAPVIEGMSQAVYGTAQRAVIPGIELCGKTGTAENPHGPDHSVFIAFAPRDNPKIAISVYVENSGWGGRAAASTASLLIEKYLKGEVKRKNIEAFVLKGEFLY